MVLTSERISIQGFVVIYTGYYYLTLTVYIILGGQFKVAVDIVLKQFFQCSYVGKKLKIESKLDKRVNGNL